MIETTLRFISIFVCGIIVGAGLSIMFAPITTSKFYSELRKRALYSSEFICKEAKQSKFLYEQYESKGN